MVEPGSRSARGYRIGQLEAEVTSLVLTLLAAIPALHRGRDGRRWRWLGGLAIAASLAAFAASRQTGVGGTRPDAACGWPCSCPSSSPASPSPPPAHPSSRSNAGPHPGRSALANLAARAEEGAIDPTFSSKFASDLIEFAAERGADRAALLSLTHLPRSVMHREDVRIPCTTMARVWSAAMEQTGDEQLALKLGVSRLFGAHRTTSLIMEASTTVLESFQLAIRYSVLIADVMSVELGEADDTVYIDFDAHPLWRAQPVAVQLDCLAISYVAAVSSLGRLVGAPQSPSLLSVALPRPADVTSWIEVFGGEPTFAAERNRIGFPAELTSLPVTTGDPGLKAAIRTYADELRAAFADEPVVAQRVIAVIVDNLTPQPPTVEAVARSMDVSPRTLQRLLRAEGLSYRALVEQVRMDLSERYLRDATHSIDEVARRVGYADTSSFVRAFKRRNGQPPGRFARGLR